MKKKRRILRKWVENLLISISISSFILMCGECESLSLFITSHIILLFIFVLSNYILYKYTNLFDKE